MKAEHVFCKDTLKVDGIDGEFIRFDIGIGWLNPKGDDHFARHWIAVIGQHKSGYYLQAGEASGSLADIAEAAVNFKDRFLVERVWLDSTAMSSASYLEEWDGLTQYKEDGKDRRGKPKYLHKPDYWPHFRNRETLAALHKVPDVFKLDLQGCIDLVGKLAKDKLFKIRKVCPRSIWVLGSSLEEMLNHPLMKAIALPLAIMEVERAYYEGDKKQKPTQRERYQRLGR